MLEAMSPFLETSLPLPQSEGLPLSEEEQYNFFLELSNVSGQFAVVAQIQQFSVTGVECGDVTLSHLFKADPFDKVTKTLKM